jgi:hypothetical protein
MFRKRISDVSEKGRGLESGSAEEWLSNLGDDGIDGGHIAIPHAIIKV